jgi:hypothetical protein
VQLAVGLLLGSRGGSACPAGGGVSVGGAAGRAGGAGRISFISVNTLELLAVYVGIPAVICGVIAACTLLPGRAKEKARLRSGPDWDYPPQWWAGDTPVQLPSTDSDAGAVAGSARGGARGAW